MRFIGVISYIPCQFLPNHTIQMHLYACSLMAAVTEAEMYLHSYLVHCHLPQYYFPHPSEIQGPVIHCLHVIHLQIFRVRVRPDCSHEQTLLVS